MNAPIQQTDLSEIELKAQEAEAHLATLEEQADALDDEAIEARRAFETEPNQETLEAKEISGQRAKNARSKAHAFAESIKGLRQGKEQQELTRELAALRVRIDGDAFSGAKKRIKELHKDFLAAMATELDVALAALRERNGSIERANHLEGIAGVGTNVRHKALDASALLDAFSQELEDEFGAPSPYAGHPQGFVQLKLSPDSNPARTLLVDLAIRIATGERGNNLASFTMPVRGR